MKNKYAAIAIALFVIICFTLPGCRKGYSEGCYKGKIVSGINETSCPVIRIEKGVPGGIEAGEAIAFNIMDFEEFYGEKPKRDMVVYFKVISYMERGDILQELECPYWRYAAKISFCK